MKQDNTAYVLIIVLVLVAGGLVQYNKINPLFSAGAGISTKDFSLEHYRYDVCADTARWSPSTIQIGDTVFKTTKSSDGQTAKYSYISDQQFQVYDSQSVQLNPYITARLSITER